MKKITGGYYIKARCIQNSEISKQPPYVREIWDWLLKEANHSDKGNIKRGQLVRSFNDIIDGLKWYVGYRKMTYKKWHCESAARAMTKAGMITTARTTRGMLITICNYDTYQNPKNYDNNYEHSDDNNNENIASTDTINKNEKNVKNKEEEELPPTISKNDKKKKPIPPKTIDEVKEYFKANGFKEESAERFFMNYSENNWYDKNGNPVLNWKSKARQVWFTEDNKEVDMVDGVYNHYKAEYPKFLKIVEQEPVYKRISYKDQPQTMAMIEGVTMKKYGIPRIRNAGDIYRLISYKIVEIAKENEQMIKKKQMTAKEFSDIIAESYSEKHDGLIYNEMLIDFEKQWRYHTTIKNAFDIVLKDRLKPRYA